MAGAANVNQVRRAAGGRRLNDLHCLDLASWTWRRPQQEGAALPAPREQCAAAVADGQLLLFGGRTSGARLNDLWCFHLASGCWEQLASHGAVPSPRQGAAATVHAGELWVMGGVSNSVHDDCCCYNLETQVPPPVLHDALPSFLTC